MKRCVLLLLMLVQSGLFAQESLKESGSWFTLSNKIQFTESLYVSQISQMRRVGFLDEIQVILLKPSINYKLSKNLSVGLGYVYFQSYPNGVRHATIKKEENRIWQHLTLSSKLGSLSLSNRFVFEERFKDVIDNTTIPNQIHGTSYSQRFRYRLLGSFNIAKFRNGPVLKGKISNELRLRFNSGLSEPDYDQNNFRSFIGFNIQPNSSIWLGYGRDHFKVHSELYVVNDIFLLTLNYNIDLSVKK